MHANIAASMGNLCTLLAQSVRQPDKCTKTRLETWEHGCHQPIVTAMGSNNHTCNTYAHVHKNPGQKNTHPSPQCPPGHRRAKQHPFSNYRGESVRRKRIRRRNPREYAQAQNTHVFLFGGGASTSPNPLKGSQRRGSSPAHLGSAPRGSLTRQSSTPAPPSRPQPHRNLSPDVHAPVLDSDPRPRSWMGPSPPNTTPPPLPPYPRPQGHIYFDTFARNEDPVREAEYNIRRFKYYWAQVCAGPTRSPVAVAWAIRTPVLDGRPP